MANTYINFPLRLPEHVHQLLSIGAFNVGKSKNRYVIDIIIKEAEKDIKQCKNTPSTK